MAFGHEPIDVYRTAIEYVGWGHHGRMSDSNADSDTHAE